MDIYVDKKYRFITVVAVKKSCLTDLLLELQYIFKMLDDLFFFHYKVSQREAKTKEMKR